MAYVMLNEPETKYGAPGRPNSYYYEGLQHSTICMNIYA